MKRGSVQDYAESMNMRKRYGKAGHGERGRLLDEFEQVTGYHRKSAILLLTGMGMAGRGGRGGTPDIPPSLWCSGHRASPSKGFCKSTPSWPKSLTFLVTTVSL